MSLFKVNLSCEELTHWKSPWCWEGLGVGGEGDDRGWDGWMASPTRCTWVWVNSRSWWWTGRPGMLWFTGSQRVRHDWATELNWTESKSLTYVNFYKFLDFFNQCYHFYFKFKCISHLDIYSIWRVNHTWLGDYSSNISRALKF